MLSLQKIKSKIKAYRHNKAGAIAIMFATLAPVVLSSAGFAIDYAQAYMVKQRLSQAIDAAALAATASSSDASVIEQKVIDFFNVNYPAHKLGATLTPEVTVQGNQVSVRGRASYNTIFMRVIGIDQIDVVADTVVQREVKGLEVVLVLDNTGSMATNNNIEKLRTAACEFVEILYGTYDADATIDCLDRYGSYVEAENEFVKVGIVPYATSVNVGPYGLGYDDDGAAYGDAFMNNPAGLSYSNDGDTDLCIVENDGLDTVDDVGPWDMYRWCRRISDDFPICYYYQDYRCNSYSSSSLQCQSYTYDYGNRAIPYAPNYICPKASVLPMTEDMTDIKDRINEMEAYGNTYGNLGMVWGLRVLSPGEPFTEGVEWENEAWRKVIVMMTDGDNVRGSNYGGYGRHGTNTVNSSSELDNRLESVCDNMEAMDYGPSVYTITFDTGGIDSDTEALYRDCAINGGRHEHITTSEELLDVFRDIAQELSNLHIKS